MTTKNRWNLAISADKNYFHPGVFLESVGESIFSKKLAFNSLASPKCFPGKSSKWLLKNL